MQADLRLGQIKSDFEKESQAATTKDEVQAAYNKGESGAIQLLAAIDTKMQEEILAVAPGYDLEPAQNQINLILTAVRVEVELNLARQKANFDLREIQKNFTDAIKAAETLDAVT